MLAHQVVDGALDLGLAGGEGARRQARRLVQVEVQVAVADVAVGDEPRLRDLGRDPGRRAFRERREAVDGQRHIVFEARAVAALPLRDVLAQLPELAAFAFALREHGIGGEAGFERRGERALQHRVERILGAGAREFAEHVPGRGTRERRAAAGDVLQHEVQRQLRHELEARHAVAARGAQVSEQLHGRRHRGDRDEGGRHGPRHREEPQRRRGDHAERAFGADEEVAQVVACVVLAQRIEAREHAAVRQHHLEAERELARHAVAQDVDAPGVGREVAADLAAALGAEAEREEAPGRRRRLLHLGQQAAGLDHHRIVERIDAPHGAHATQRQHELGAAVVGRGGAAVTGVAALRYHPDAQGVAEREQLRDLGGAARQRERERPAPVEPPVVDGGRLERGRVGDDDLGAEARDELRERRGRPARHHAADAASGGTASGVASRQPGLVSSSCTSPSCRST